MEETPREIAPGDGQRGSEREFIHWNENSAWLDQTTWINGLEEMGWGKKCESTNDRIWSSKKTDAGMLEECGSGF